VLRAELVNAGPETQRFLREIRIAARLSHPNILPLLDSGSLPAAGAGQPAVPYFAMPFVDGETLRDRLDREGRIPIDEAIRIGTNIADALDYAHRQGVVHRDVKPENILLHEGQAVVADFGIARAVSAVTPDDVTGRGLIVGTPAYMSPEQVSGEGGLDGRSDLYALAVVLFEMVTGSPPFRGESTRATLLKHLVDPVPALATRGASVAPPFERALARGLAKDPADRWPTGRALLDAIADAARSGAAEPAIAGSPRSIAVLPFVNASRDPENEYLVDGITDELIAALAKLGGFEVTSRAAVFAYKSSEAGAVAIGRALGVEALLTGTVRRAADRLRVHAELTRVSDGYVVWTERYDRAMGDLFAIESEIANRIVDAVRIGFLRAPARLIAKRYTESPVAHQLYLKGRYAWNLRTPESTAQAKTYFEQAIAADPSYALAYAGLADAHSLDIDYRAAPVTHGMQLARINAERAIALDDDLAEAHTSLGWVNLIYDWDWARAGEEFERALTLNPRYATARQWYAWYLVVTSRIEEAIGEARIARDLDPTSASIQRSLGWVHYYARQPDRSIAELERALALNPTSDETLWIMGLALTQLGRYDEAERALRESHANSRAYLHALASLASLAAVRGRLTEARAILGEIETAARSHYVSPVDFVRVYVALGDRDPAFHFMELAFIERRGWLCYLNVDPALDSVRDDPRFRALVSRMRFPGDS
jgi:serine/threonine-protein kinase